MFSHFEPQLLPVTVELRGQRSGGGRGQQEEQVSGINGCVGLWWCAHFLSLRSAARVVLEQTEALQAIWPWGQRSGVGGRTVASRDLRTMSFFERLGPFV